jgi:hypothetical protein
MTQPYPSFRQLAVICRSQAAATTLPGTSQMLLELASEYEAQAQAEEAGRQDERTAA